jgi:hypothetical protein
MRHLSSALGFFAVAACGLGVACSSSTPSSGHAPDAGVRDTAGGATDSGNSMPDATAADTAPGVIDSGNDAADAASDAPRDAAGAEGAPSDGATGDGATGDSATADSAASDSATGDSATADGAGDAARGDGASGDGEAGGPRKRVFFTNATFPGQIDPNGIAIDGVEAADQACQNAAFVVGLGGTWVAWLGDLMTQPTTHVRDASPWYLVDRTTLVFATYADLTSSAGPAHAIDQDEMGFPVGVDSLVWTGTQSFGIVDVINNCNNWTMSAAGMQGAVGDATATTLWTTALPPTSGCDQMHHLYCFEQ